MMNGRKFQIQFLLRANCDTYCLGHPDFAQSSKTAAESSVYEAPMRNGEPVMTQFYLPIRFTLLEK